MELCAQRLEFYYLVLQEIMLMQPNNSNSYQQREPVIFTRALCLSAVLTRAFISFKFLSVLSCFVRFLWVLGLFFRPRFLFQKGIKVLINAAE